MDKLLLILMFSFSAISHSQQFNIRNYGAKGDGKSDDTPAFERAIADLYRINLVQKKHVVLFLPSGEYLLSKPIILNKYISIEGQFVNSTIIKITSTGCEGIILEDNKAEKDIYNGYNSIKNLSIHGPDFDKNSFAWKDNKRNNPKSVGIKIMGLRNRVENCVIDGFLWSGIELSSTYYNFITHNFIRNNRVGICIDKTSTTTYVSNNEIRTNAIGIIIQNQSYANFVNNNLIEANISNFLENDTTEDAAISLTKGIGILLQNTSNNFIQNNYFELHFINIALANTNYNEISSNFMAIGDMMPAYSKNQSVLKFFGDVKNNRIIGNQTLGTNPQINNTKMIFTDGDYSTNTVDFGGKKNNEIKTEFLKKGKNAKKMPQFPTF